MKYILLNQLFQFLLESLIHNFNAGIKNSETHLNFILDIFSFHSTGNSLTEYPLRCATIISSTLPKPVLLSTKLKSSNPTSFFIIRNPQLLSFILDFKKY